MSHLAAFATKLRDFIAARRKADTELLLPLDKVHAKHPDMVLIHGGTPKGAERAAACWADNRKVVQIAFKPDWTRDGKAAPFKRNDRMLEIVPAGVIVFPGSGITANLADKAKKLGIPGSRPQGGRRVSAACSSRLTWLLSANRCGNAAKQ